MSTTISPSSVVPCWNPPPADMVKFSVDRAATSDKAGCGELMKIFMALELFKEAKWMDQVVELVEIFRDIDSLVAQIGNVQFQHVSREKNYLLDFMAKSCLQRSNFFKSWW
ncbi:hypothetical protein V6N13_023190 [Hibiscus sabdariffa]